MQFAVAPMQALLHLVAAPLQQIVDGIDPAHRADIRRLDDQHTPFGGVWTSREDRVEGIQIAGLRHEQQIDRIRRVGAAARIAYVLITMATEPEQRRQAGRAGDPDGAHLTDARARQNLRKRVGQRS